MNPLASAQPVTELVSRNARLSRDPIQKIAAYFTLQDCGRFSLVSKGMYTLLNSEGFAREICQIFYERFEKLYPSVKNLDRLGAWKLLGLPEYKGPESLGSLRDHMHFLRGAGRIAEKSEDGKAVTITIPKGWGIDKLEEVSAAAVKSGIASARIYFFREADKIALRNNPTKETQLVALSCSVIKSSRSKPTCEMRKLLRASNLRREFPDLITAITVAAVIRILTGGHESAYNVRSEEPPRLFERVCTYTYVKQKDEEGCPLLIGSFSSYLLVSRSDQAENIFGDDDYGIGAFRKFKKLS